MTFHGDVHDQEMLLARQVRAADDTRTSSAGPPTASDLNRRATEHGVAAIWQDARESLDYSVRTYYTKAGITCLQRTTTLPDGVRVRGSHCVTIGEPGGIRITFYPAGRRGEEGGDGGCGCGGPAELQLVGIGTGEVDRVTRRMGWLRIAAPARWGEGTAGNSARANVRCSSPVFRGWSPAMRESLPQPA